MKPSYLILLTVFLSACTSQQDKDRIAQLEKQVQTLSAALAEKTAHAPIPDSQVYTLYRSSDFGTDIRVHVATFDSRSLDDPSENKQYNYEICSDAQLKFNQRNKGNNIRFWCEEGRFKEKLQ